MHTHPAQFSSARRAFTVMELVVCIAILLILGAIAVPVYNTMRTRANHTIATNNLRQLGISFSHFVSENDYALPQEDAMGGDTWTAAADPINAKIWYNALPKLSNTKGVGDYLGSASSFYHKDNILYLPGAKYPNGDSKLTAPLFAIAMNSRLQRKDPLTGVKDPVLANKIAKPSRTVIFLERGLKGEKAATKAAPKYDGRPKANGRAFVERYSGKGVLLFVDGHTESVQADDIMDETARLLYPQTNIVWTATGEDDPN
ncbi:MAG: prepilin-type N-terminal cleavage/methylation domain-containing protein [Chthoniobacterales bacterium]